MSCEPTKWTARWRGTKRTDTIEAEFIRGAPLHLPRPVITDEALDEIREMLDKDSGCGLPAGVLVEGMRVVHRHRGGGKVVKLINQAFVDWDEGGRSTVMQHLLRRE